MIVTTYNQHVRLLSSEPFGWFAPPKFTRTWEPTLLWNHYTQHAAAGVLSEMAQREPPLQLFPRLGIQVRHTEMIGMIIDGPIREHSVRVLRFEDALERLIARRCRQSYGR